MVKKKSQNSFRHQPAFPQRNVIIKDFVIGEGKLLLRNIQEDGLTEIFAFVEQKAGFLQVKVIAWYSNWIFPKRKDADGTGKLLL